ncbi:6079_t:CDS:2 [Racocetra fulgida]|uniref:6079_t:CDS:1 n=1 Tax=Racocetra fulgida TaxID=60492 RepID=A0A9N8VIP3_9GLOM|nr:6079_t:CDS:2 [Racocetra fulgida]
MRENNKYPLEYFIKMEEKAEALVKYVSDFSRISLINMAKKVER